MIRGLGCHGSIEVISNYSGYQSPQIDLTSRAPLIGMVRYNSSGQNLEAYDGVQWQILPSAYSYLQLTKGAESAISWARKKMEEESYILDLSRNYPAVKELMDAKHDIQAKLNLIVALIQPETKI